MIYSRGLWNPDRTNVSFEYKADTWYNQPTLSVILEPFKEGPGWPLTERWGLSNNQFAPVTHVAKVYQNHS